MNEHIRHGMGGVRPYLHGPVSLVTYVAMVFAATPSFPCLGLSILRC
ncbi:hypothetical protein [Bisbaumannia pacifica]|uniref:Uncharacterized protein n=1 Tax=Bisbaumannia pacifica TaxID=77098 RepID=A0ABD4KYB5_9GAMM|nr:hypothetical protein [Halomonas pacifica]MBH8579304.1 hypothetical protein [Halomonas pacifica]